MQVLFLIVLGVYIICIATNFIAYTRNVYTSYSVTVVTSVVIIHYTVCYHIYWCVHLSGMRIQYMFYITQTNKTLCIIHVKCTSPT